MLYISNIHVSQIYPTIVTDFGKIAQQLGKELAEFKVEYL